MALHITRANRINNVAGNLVDSLVKYCEHAKNLMTEGLDVKDEKINGRSMPDMKATGDEVRDALGENAALLDTVIEFVLDGKSNRITKGRKKKA